MSKTLATIVFPNIQDIQSTIAQYPDRPMGQMVTRIAPSPTGFLHVGTLYTGLLNEKLTHQNNGVFIVRIEDTDQARNTTNFAEQSGGIYSIIKWLNFFEIPYDEWVRLLPDGSFEMLWNYWPYIQSERLNIYKSFIKYLLETDQAYVCFLTPEELEKIRTSQQLSKQATGIYGSYALSRVLSEDEVIAKINAGNSYVIRRKANTKPGDKVTFIDGIKGSITMDDNYADQIILKSDGFPSYALAHIADDYLMGTTHVVRSDEWLASVPYHLQLFGGFREVFTRSQWLYNHNSPVEKLDNGNRRKLSKRKDPEADVQVLLNQGYPPEGIKVYLMSLLNSNFEDRRKESNKEYYTSYTKFEVSLEKCNTSGAIFDINKLHHICSEYLAIVPLDELVSQVKTFYSNTNQASIPQLNSGQNLGLSAQLEQEISKLLSFDRSKKIHTTYQNIIDYITPFFADTLSIDQDLLPVAISQDLRLQIISAYITYIQNSLFGTNDEIIRNKEERFEDLKEFGKQFKIATNNAEFKEGWYIAKIWDLAMILRVALYGSSNTPDIYEMIKIYGKQKTCDRLSQIA